MTLLIAGVLDEAALHEAQDLAATLIWRDGAETAGATARQVKHNLQADLSSRTGVKLRDMLTKAVTTHPVLQAAAHPKRFSTLLVSKTEAGGAYGLHVDNAFMGEGAARLRTDLSFTLFLSAPESYAGGELVVELAGMQQSFKPAAGDLVLYPSTSLHQVAPVSHGARLACVGWIESAVPDAAARDILFDLENLRASLATTHEAQSPEMLTLAKSISNLLRRFGQ